MRTNASEQHVVFALSSKTRIELDHNFGDDFAFLKIRSPQKGLVDELKEQTGPFLVDVERIGFRKNILTLRIHLSSPETMVTQQLLRNPRSVLLTFSRSNERPMPEPWKLVAPMSRVYKLPPPPVTLPQMSDKNPCPNVNGTYMLIRYAKGGDFVDRYTARAVLREAKDPMCKDFVKALLAESALKRNDDVYPFERWAFEMQDSRPWSGFEPQQQRALLVASAVLVRRQLYPEAHLLLHRVDQLGDYGLAPFARITRAHIYLAEGATQDTLEIVYPLTTGQAEPASWHFTAYHIYLSVAASSENVKGAMEAALRAEKHLPLKAKRNSDLWLFGGEMAMELKNYDHATTLFQRASEEGLPWQRSLALMRLGDIEVHLNGEDGLWKASSTLWKRAKKNLRKPWVSQMLRLRETLATPTRPGLDPARAVKDLYALALTRELKAESAFALAHIALIRGNPPQALALAKHLLEIMPEQGEWPIVDKIVSSSVNGYFDRLARKGSWLDIIREYNLGLKEYQNYLNGNTMFVVAKAHAEIGLHLRSAEIFLDVLSTNYEQLDHRMATHWLWKSYVALEDYHRAELVARYFRSRYPGSGVLWEYGIQEAIDLIRSEKPKEGIRVLDAQLRKVPSGDDRDRVELVRAEALSRLKQGNKASKLFQKTMLAPALDPLEIKRVGTHVLSECARSCSDKELNKLVKTALKNPDKMPLNERMRYLLAERGIQLAGEEKQTPVSNLPKPPIEKGEEVEKPETPKTAPSTQKTPSSSKEKDGSIWNQLRQSQDRLDEMIKDGPKLIDTETSLQKQEGADETPPPKDEKPADGEAPTTGDNP